VVVSLPTNPSTGYQWKVVSTDGAFGYPAKTDYLPEQPVLDGSGGIDKLTWKTNSDSICKGDTHSVKLEYTSPGGTPSKTFSFTVISSRALSRSSSTVDYAACSVGQKLRSQIEEMPEPPLDRTVTQSSPGSL